MTPTEQAKLDQVFQQNANLYQALKALLQNKVADAETQVKANNMAEAATWHRAGDSIFE
jgi:hypothetical protein